jgi:hypothetical protein
VLQPIAKRGVARQFAAYHRNLCRKLEATARGEAPAARPER